MPSELAALPFRFVSLADPDAVPAGRYAKAYLNAIDSSVSISQESVWQSIRERILPATDVRAAAGMVENMPDIIGIVYKTDAMASNKLRIIYEFEYNDIPQLEPIEYIAAGVKKHPAIAATVMVSREVNAFLDYLGEGEAQSIFQRYGFTTLGD